MRCPQSIGLLVAAISATGCASHGGDVPLFSIALDTHGASNSQCTMTVAHDDRHISFNIAPPLPAGPDTSLAPLAPPAICAELSSDAGRPAQVTSPDAVALMVTRTPTTLCASSHDLAFMTQLGYSPNGTGMCPVLVSLSCGGVGLYDRVAWTSCAWLG